MESESKMETRGFLGAGARLFQDPEQEWLCVAQSATWSQTEAIFLPSPTQQGWEVKGRRSHTRCPPEPAPPHPCPQVPEPSCFLEPESVPTRLAATKLLSPLQLALRRCSARRASPALMRAGAALRSGPAPIPGRQIHHWTPPR